MSVIKGGRYPISLDKERHILFSMGVMADLQEQGVEIEEIKEFIILNGKARYKNIIWLLTKLLNEAEENEVEHLSESNVRKLIYPANMEYVVGSIFKCFAKDVEGNKKQTDDLNDDTDDEEDTEKNAMSGQV